MEKGRITLKQFSVLIFLFTLGDAILVLPSAVIYAARQDGWLSGILGMFLGTFIIFLYYKVGSSHPGQSFVQICESLLGKWVGKAIAFLFVFYAWLSVALLLRELSDFFLVHYLRYTPIQMIMALFVVTAALAVRLGIEIIGRAAEIFLPWVVFCVLLSFLLLVGKLDFDKLLPILDNGVKPVLEGGIQFIAYPYLETVALLMFFPLMKDDPVKLKHILLPSFLGGLVLLVATLMAIVVLGPNLAGNILYPTLKLAQEIKVGSFLQRMDILVATVWLLTLFFKTTFYLYAATMGISQLTRVTEFRFLVFPLAFLAVPVGLNAAEDIVDFNAKLVSIWPFVDMTVGLFIPLLLMLVFFVKKRRKKQSIVTN